jgi:hypothetical protein
MNLSIKTQAPLDRKIILAIIVVAALLRLASALYQGNTVTDLPGIYDQISYDGLARRVISGHGFSFAEAHWPATRAGEPTAHWSYLYTIYLVAIYKIFGTFPLMARLIQALIAGIFQTLLLWRIGTRLFNRNVGLVAAALNAIYIYFFYYAGSLVTETFYITAVLWVFDVSLRIVAADRSDAQVESRIKQWQWLELGLALGVTILFRQVFLLFMPFLFLWLWWNVRKADAANTNIWLKRLHWYSLKGLLSATIILVLMIIPCTIRNYRAFGTFVLVNTNAGYAFFWGNHPIYGTNFIPLLPAGTEGYYSLIPVELRSLNEAELDKALLKRGIQFVVDDPKRFILLSVSRTREFFKFWPSPESSLLSNISRVGSFGIFLPFMVYGLWLGVTRAWKSGNNDMRWDVGLLIIFVVVYTAMHLFSWALIRYRLPVDAVLLIFAGLGLENILKKIPLLQRLFPDHV